MMRSPLAALAASALLALTATPMESTPFEPLAHPMALGRLRPLLHVQAVEEDPALTAAIERVVARCDTAQSPCMWSAR